MSVPTLIEMVEANPRLYDALRERDSAANLVCEILGRNGQVDKAMHAWKKTCNKVKYEVAKAIQAIEESRG